MAENATTEMQPTLGLTGLTMNETGTPGKGARFEIRIPVENVVDIRDPESTGSQE